MKLFDEVSVAGVLFPLWVYVIVCFGVVNWAWVEHKRLKENLERLDAAKGLWRRGAWTIDIIIGLAALVGFYALVVWLIIGVTSGI